MTNHTPVIFDKHNSNNEEQYQTWLTQNPDGFVVNTTWNTRERANYMVLHRATCKSISNYTAKKKWGGYTQRNYIKVCAQDIESLRDWIKNNGRPNGSFTREFPRCCKQDWRV
ncbi:MAG: hypothetical protein HS114_15610 [Anaerolineales bacterium]|nr:hypothetical protein [Anaerolineales bacterium]MBE7470558.1 hypothetical protein [Anaerolineales bacterium]